MHKELDGVVARTADLNDQRVFRTIWLMLSIKSWEERKKGVTCGVVKFLFLRNYHMG